MSFTLSVTVPRITRAQIEEMEAKVPGLTSVVSIPVIETEEEALRAADRLADKFLTSREYVASTESVFETATGWDIKLICSGD